MDRAWNVGLNTSNETAPFASCNFLNLSIYMYHHLREASLPVPYIKRRVLILIFLADCISLLNHMRKVTALTFLISELHTLVAISMWVKNFTSTRALGWVVTLPHYIILKIT